MRGKRAQAKKKKYVESKIMTEIRVFSRNPNFLAEKKVQREAKAARTGSRVRLPHALLAVDSITGKKKQFTKVNQGDFYTAKWTTNLLFHLYICIYNLTRSHYLPIHICIYIYTYIQWGLASIIAVNSEVVISNILDWICALIMSLSNIFSIIMV